jgi:hypothetical protein
MLVGDLTYHNKENLEGAETWNLAPQIGDYFKLSTSTGIDEEWEISQIYNKILTSKGGINPLLGKYIFQCTAVKRQASYERNTAEMELKEPGNDLDEIFGNQTISNNNAYSDNFTTTDTGKNKQNKKTEKHAKSIYDYENKSDQTYGRISK